MCKVFFESHTCAICKVQVLLFFIFFIFWSKFAGVCLLTLLHFCWNWNNIFERIRFQTYHPLDIIKSEERIEAKYVIGQKSTMRLLISTLAWLNHKGPSHSTSEVASTAATASLWRLKRRPWKQELAIGYNMARCQVSPIGLSRSYLLQLEAFSIHHASFGIADIRWKFNPLYSITSSLTTTE